jgi:hypothetical protein
MQPREGQSVYHIDARTGEIVIRWFYYHPEPPPGEEPEALWFNKRLDPRQYLSKEGVVRDYHINPDTHPLPYQECAARCDTHGRWHTRYWYARERVEAARQQTPGRQLGLFE